MKEKKTLVVLGGELSPDFLKTFYQELQPELVIAADGALAYIQQSGIPCQYGLGDFDTIASDILEKIRCAGETTLIAYPPEKDQTDSELAIDLALQQGASEIWIVGACGRRLDHMIGNLGLLKRALDGGVGCWIADAQNQITLVKKQAKFQVMEGWKYISFLAYTDVATGITLQGFRYPLQNGRMERGSTLGISNEVTEEFATVTVEKGILYCIRSKDL